MSLFSALSGDNDALGIRALVHLTCNKWSLRLTKGAKRKAWCLSVAECLNSVVIFSQVNYSYFRTYVWHLVTFIKAK